MPPPRGRSRPVVVLDQALAVWAVTRKAGRQVRRSWADRRDEWLVVGGGIVIGCTVVIAVTALVFLAQSDSDGSPSPVAQRPPSTSTETGAPVPTPAPSGSDQADSPADEAVDGWGSSTDGSSGGSRGGGSAPAAPDASSGGSGAGGSRPEPTVNQPPGGGGEIQQPALTARYATEGTDLLVLGYRGSVTITNPGTAPVDGWTVTVTLPLLSLTVTDVTGATASQDGGAWTFVPSGGTGTVPAGGSVRIGFRVTGVTVAPQPTGCTIDGRPCAGL